MAEDWFAIAAEAAAAIADVGFVATLIRPGPGGPTHPHDTAPAPTPITFDITIIDDGIVDRYAPGGLVTGRARTLTVGATGVVPQKADRIVVRGVTHEVDEVLETAPGGVAVLYEVRLVA